MSGKLPKTAILFSMTPSQRLHTQARRICIQRHSFWCDKYDPLVLSGKERDGYYYTDEACDIFPRYNVLQSALADIETFDFDNLPSFQEFLDLMSCVGQLENSDLERSSQTQIAAHAEADELQKLRHSIANFDASAENNVQPLFYRRVLTDIELEDHWKATKKRWGADGGYWYPLSEKTHPELIFRSLQNLDEEIVNQKIQEFLSKLQGPRIYELREHGESYEIDKEAPVFSYNGAEGYWFDQSKNWIVYCSHEGTMTMGGTISPVLDGLPQEAP